MSNDTFTDSIAKAGKKTGAAAAEMYHDSGVAARRTATDLSALADAVSADTRHGVSQLTRAVENESSKVLGYVRESIQTRPNLTIGLAASLGIVIGMMLTSRR
jgi:ElaB/YqjD/DUF883 family membrane-anchored ribosome-binding protein